MSQQRGPHGVGGLRREGGAQTYSHANRGREVATLAREYLHTPMSQRHALTPMRPLIIPARRMRICGATLRGHYEETQARQRLQ